MERYHVHVCLNGIRVFVKDGRKRKMIHLVVRAPRTFREHSEVYRYFATKSSNYHPNVFRGSVHWQDDLPRYFVWGYWREKTKSHTRTALSNSRTKWRIRLQVVPNFWKLQRRATHFVFHHRCTWNMVSLVPRLRKKKVDFYFVQQRCSAQGIFSTESDYKLRCLQRSTATFTREHSASSTWARKWLLVHENARSHMTLFIKDFLSVHQMTFCRISHILQICLLAIFFSFPLLKGALRGHAPGGNRTHDFSRWAACGRSPAEIVGSNPTGGMDTCLLWVSCVVR